MGVNTAGLWIEQPGQRIDIGVFELDQRPIVENRPRQRVLHGKLGEDLLVGRGAGLGLADHRQLELFEEDLTELFDRTDLELLAGRLVTPRLCFGDAFGELPGKLLEDLLVDRDAVGLHSRQDRDQRQLELLVELVELALFEHRPELGVEQPGDVGVLGRVVAGFFEAHVGKGLFVAGDLVVGNHAVRQVDQGEVVELVRASVRAQQIVGQQGVTVDAANLYAVSGEDLEVVFEVLTGDSDVWALDEWRHDLFDLVPLHLWFEGRVGHRHVPGHLFVGAEGEPDEIGLQRIERGGLGVESKTTGGRHLHS
jgi:hypothetical protein